MQQSTNAIQMLPDDVRKLWIRLAAGLRKATNVRGIYDLTKWIGDRYPSPAGTCPLLFSTGVGSLDDVCTRGWTVSVNINIHRHHTLPLS
jgi:hypothetical protein